MPKLWRPCRVNLKGAINGIEAAVEEFSKDPPPKEVAQVRADVCTGRLSGNPCPHNFRGAWRVTDLTAAVIKAQLEKKRDLALHVDWEDKLGTCKACSCPLFLKVFYNWSTIYNHTSDEQFEKQHSANPECWMWKEYLEHKQP